MHEGPVVSLTQSTRLLHTGQQGLGNLLLAVEIDALTNFLMRSLAHVFAGSVMTLTDIQGDMLVMSPNATRKQSCGE